MYVFVALMLSSIGAAEEPYTVENAVCCLSVEGFTMFSLLAVTVVTLDRCISPRISGRIFQSLKLMELYVIFMSALKPLPSHHVIHVELMTYL